MDPTEMVSEDNLDEKDIDMQSVDLEAEAGVRSRKMTATKQIVERNMTLIRNSLKNKFQN